MANFFRSCCNQVHFIIHLFTNYIRMLRGVWKISKLKPPIVTVFGGSKISQDHPYALKARAFGSLLAEHGISVITGGGPGIMEAANCGVFQEKNGVRSIGISVSGLGEMQKITNAC